MLIGTYIYDVSKEREVGARNLRHFEPGKLCYARERETEVALRVAFRHHKYMALYTSLFGVQDPITFNSLLVENQSLHFIDAILRLEPYSSVRNRKGVVIVGGLEKLRA